MYLQARGDVTMSRYDGGRGPGLPLSPHLDHGPPSPDQHAQFKPKRKLMTKFLNEPVDALDLRLANAEKNLSTLPVDPFTDIKQEVSYVILYTKGLYCNLQSMQFITQDKNCCLCYEKAYFRSFKF